MNKIYIFGAHSRAATVAHYLKYLDNEITIESFLYDNDEINPVEIDGIPVIKINEETELNPDYRVYIGTRGVFHDCVKELLLKCGLVDIIPVDVAFDTDIRNRYLKKFYEEKGWKFEKIADLDAVANKDNDATIFIAKSIYDKELKNPLADKAYEKIIQVGATLTEDRIPKAAYLDSTGENISDRNRQFCELTAMYWIWKNSNENIVGLEHYRRKFILEDNWITKFEENEVDVILPIPLYVYPSLEGNFLFRHDKNVWGKLQEYVKNNMPDEFEELNGYFKGNGLYSPCNMIIARKEVFDELCEWMFPILFYIAEDLGEFEDKYQNRYPGFVSERLITYFFESKRNKYKLVYADKTFLE